MRISPQSHHQKLTLWCHETNWVPVAASRTWIWSSESHELNSEEGVAVIFFDPVFQRWRINDLPELSWNTLCITVDGCAPHQPSTGMIRLRSRGEHNIRQEWEGIVLFDCETQQLMDKSKVVFAHYVPEENIFQRKKMKLQHFIFETQVVR